MATGHAVGGALPAYYSLIGAAAADILVAELLDLATYRAVLRFAP